MQMPIFDRNQGEIARAAFAITQAQEQERFANGQVLTDVRDAFENLRTNDQVVGLYRSGYLDEAQQSRDISEYAYRHGAASLLDFLDAERSYRATQLGLPAGARFVPARARTASRGCRNQELAMRTSIDDASQSAMALALALTLTACSCQRSTRRAGQMTSLLGQRLAVCDAPAVHDSARPDVARPGGDGPTNHDWHARFGLRAPWPTTLLTPRRSSPRLAGPVSRILVVPGQHVKTGQPMLEVSSPDYSQLLDAYLKAADSFRLADKN